MFYYNQITQLLFLLREAPSKLRRRNLKRSFLSTVKPTVHTNLSR